MAEPQRLRVLMPDGSIREMTPEEVDEQNRRLDAVASGQGRPASATPPAPPSPRPLVRYGETPAVVERPAPANPLLGFQRLLDWGAPESAASLGARAALGAAMGGAPGLLLGTLVPMAAAGATRYARGRATGESPETATTEAVLTALPEAVPLGGEAARRAGTRIVRGVLPISADEAKEFARGVAHRGAERLAELVTRIPRIRLEPAYDYVTQRIKHLTGLVDQAAQQAAREGKTVAARPVVAAGRGLTAPGGLLREQIAHPAEERAARAVVRNIEQKLEEEVPLTVAELQQAVMNAGLPTWRWAPSPTGGKARVPLDQAELEAMVRALGQPTTKRVVAERVDPERALQILRNTQFVSGGAREGEALARRTMREELSQQFRTAVPEAAGPMQEQYHLIPIQQAMGEALFGSSGPVRLPEIIVSGRPGQTAATAPRAFGIFRPFTTKVAFATGQMLAKGGRALAPPTSAALARALWEALLGPPTPPGGSPP